MVSVKHTFRRVGASRDVNKADWDADHEINLTTGKILVGGPLGKAIEADLPAGTDLSAYATVASVNSGLAGKQPAGNYAVVGHTHVIGSVVGLQDALDAKQPAGSYALATHTHVIADITGLQDALDNAQPNVTVVSVPFTTTSGPQEVVLPHTVAADKVFLTLNGLGQMYTTDYTVAGNILSLTAGTAGWQGLARYFLSEAGGGAVDTTAPVLTLPTATATGVTTANAGATTDEANGTMHVVASSSPTGPTPAQVESGLNHLGVASPAASSPVTVAGAKSIGISGLTGSTSYYAHVMHKDETGNRSAVATSAVFTTSAAGDVTAPILTLPTGAQTGSTTATGGATTDEPNGTIATVMSTSATPPTAVQVMAGQDHNGTARPFNSATVTIAGAKSLSVTGLTASTTYYAHTAHRDAAGNHSNVVTSASFTTAAVAGDTTAPVLSNPFGEAISDGRANGVADTNEGNGTLYAIATTSATPPSTSAILGGATRAITASGRYGVTISGLSDGVTYYAHLYHVDAAGNGSNVVTTNSFVATGGGAPPPSGGGTPVLSNGSVLSTSTATARAALMTDSGSGNIYSLATTSATPPSTTTLVNTGNRQDVDETGNYQVSFAGLSAGTAYWAHHYQVNASGVGSNILTTAFTSRSSGTENYLYHHTVVAHPYSETFFTSSDANVYSSIAYDGQRTHEMMAVSGPNTQPLCWMYIASFSDGSPNLLIAIESTVGTEINSRNNYAIPMAQALGRMPKIFRDNLREGTQAAMLVPYAGGTGVIARAESQGHFIAISKYRFDTRVVEGNLEELMFHELVHACLQQQASGKGFNHMGTNSAPVTAWTNAVNNDLGKYATERGATGGHAEDFAETGQLAYILKYRASRIPAAERTIIEAQIPSRLAYFNNTIFTVAGI